jgi:hypothetical protein
LHVPRRALSASHWQGLIRTFILCTKAQCRLFLQAVRKPVCCMGLTPVAVTSCSCSLYIVGGAGCRPHTIATPGRHHEKNCFGYRPVSQVHAGNISNTSAAHWQ